jgi:MFS family permease
MAETEAVTDAGIWATFRDSPRAVKTILCGVMVNRLSGFLNIFLVLLLTARGYSTGQAVVAVGVYGAGGIVGSLIGGALADRLGPRNATVISMAGTSVLTASLLFLPSYALALAAVALVGLSAQIFRPASATLLSELTADHRQVMIFAIYRFGLNVGAVAAPLIGFGLYNLDHQRYTLLLLGEAVIAMTYAVFAWLLLPARAAHHDAAPAGGGDIGSAGYLAVLRDRRYVLFLLATFLNTAVYVQYLSTLPLTVNAAHLKIVWYTLAVSLNGFVVIAFELLATKVTQGWATRLPIAVGLALIGTGVAIYGLPMVPAVILAGTLVWSLGEIISGPSLFAYPAIAGRGPLKGRYIGSFQFVFGIGSTAGPLIGGWLFIQIGQAVWPVLAVGSLVAAASMLVAVRGPSGAPEPAAQPAQVADQSTD